MPGVEAVAVAVAVACFVVGWRTHQTASEVVVPIGFERLKLVAAVAVLVVAAVAVVKRGKHPIVPALADIAVADVAELEAVVAFAAAEQDMRQTALVPASLQPAKVPVVLVGQDKDALFALLLECDSST